MTEPSDLNRYSFWQAQSLADRPGAYSGSLALPPQSWNGRRLRRTRGAGVGSRIGSQLVSLSLRSAWETLSLSGLVGLLPAWAEGRKEM